VAKLAGPPKGAAESINNGRDAAAAFGGEDELSCAN
jgi:hypothetical protein